MRLPTPNEQEVEELRALYKSQTGVELTRQRAHELGTMLLHIFYIKHYGIHPLCPEE